jgi:hypothetical protein
VSRKPIDQQQPSQCRHAVWEEIKMHNQHGSFSVIEIAHSIRLGVDTVRDYLAGLCNAGYLLKVNRPMPESHRTQYYILDNDTGCDAPRVRKDGTPVTQGQGRQQMWNAMRILKSFTATDLAFNASTDDHRVAEKEAQTYCAILCKAGYLVGRAEQRYMLIEAMWTGPHPPQIQRTKQVYDPNLKRVVWARVEGGAE